MGDELGEEEKINRAEWRGEEGGEGEGREKGKVGIFYLIYNN